MSIFLLQENRKLRGVRMPFIKTIAIILRKGVILRNQYVSSFITTLRQTSTPNFVMDRHDGSFIVWANIMGLTITPEGAD